jgi:predicted acyltransferase
MASSAVRLKSLDALRGLTIIGMIIVNTPGDWGHVYHPLCHADWIGCTPTDLVFPFFLFISGFSLYISITRRISIGDSKSQLVKHLSIRSAMIFLIGLLLNGFPYYELSTFRILGVLQRIALVNFFAGLLLIYTSYKTRIGIGAAILIGYCMLFSLIPSPLTGTCNIDYETNWASWLDQIILGKHTWQWMPLMDPEGILSTLPAIVTGLLGIEVSRRFHKMDGKDSAMRKVIFLLVTGAILTFAGLAWSTLFPFIKKLWTSSYVLYTAGLASTVLGLFYWYADVREKKLSFGLLYAFGLNPLTLYVGSELLIMIIGLFPVFGVANVPLNNAMVQNLSDMGMAPKFASMLWAALYVSVFAVLAWVMYKKKWVIKL